MGNQLQLGGAQPAKPTRFASLWNEYFSAGLITQRNPLRPGKGSSLQNKYYGSDNDALLDGLNVEVSNRLTMVRRPGSSVYNAQVFPPIDNFYEFRLFDANTESIKVIADTSSIVYDATGPSTKIALLNKATGAGEAYFQSVGNTLYIGDGVEQKQYIQSGESWAPLTLFTYGEFIVDTNGNIQSLFNGIGSVSTIVGSEIDIHLHSHGAPTFTATLTLSAATSAVTGQEVTFNGLTVATILNTNSYLVTVNSPTSITVTVSRGPNQAFSVDTGTATFSGAASGTTGTTQPTWNTTLGGTTLDGSVTWINRGPAVQNWGIAPPTSAPTLTQAPITSPYGSWVASTFYSTSLCVIPTTSGDLNLLTTPGTTGSSEPTWNPTVGGTTADGSAVWTNVNGSWTSTTAFTAGQYCIGQAGVIGYVFKITTAGTTGGSQPTWTSSLGSFVYDNSIVWENVGPVLNWATIGATVAVTTTQTILDPGGYVQNIATSGLSGSAAPSWNETLSGYTPDNAAMWINLVAYAAATTGAVVYAYSYENSITGGISTAGPLSVQFFLAANYNAIVQGGGSSDPQVDTIVIWRTVQGGSILLYDGRIPAPAGGSAAIWTYTDTIPDTGLDIEIEAPIALSNNPPPTGLTKMTYHLNRIWGVVNNSVYFSGGPDTTTGNGNEAFPLANVFVFPDVINRLFASTLGLFVFTVSDVYLIQGTTTATFFSVPFCIGLGLQNYNAFAVNGSTLYMFTSDYQLASLDISSGVNEVGFNIGDQFLKSNWNASTARLTWHISGSPDKGLYVSDFSSGWFRLYPTPSPESGNTWAPFAALTGGCSQVQSVETSPGTHNLLIAPQTSGPILKRDDSVFTDNGQAYDAFFLLGSIVLAQPGQLAEVVFLTTDSIATGTRPSISIQLDEIAPYSAGMFESLPAYVADPTQLSPSVSMYSQRFYLSQTQQPALCRNIQIRMDWGTDTVQNELLSLTVFGGFSAEL